MRYASIFGTIVFIWFAVILMAITRHTGNQVFYLYLAAIIATIVLFLIGFINRR